MAEYEVKQGDYLKKIAEAHGVADWKKIYYADENEEFREKRPDPDILYPGDIIFIPDEVMPKFKSGEKHKVKVKIKPKAEINIQFKDDFGKPIVIKKYEIKTDGEESATYEGVNTSSESDLNKGIIYEEISTKEESAEIKLWYSREDGEPDEIYNFDIGHLDPIDTPTGIQSRLQLLGIDTGKIDGDIGPYTKSAIQSLQMAYDMTMDGEINSDIQNKIKELFGR